MSRSAERPLVYPETEVQDIAETRFGRLRKTFNFGRFTAPRREAGRYFHMHNSGLRNQSTLIVQDGLQGAPRVLLDPNSWASDGATGMGKPLAKLIEEVADMWAFAGHFTGLTSSAGEHAA